ncbi:MAG TPA: class I SAM-dependent methyltransferase [Kiritimatiellia bacterium]|nr:class I SAM-dependent methyltransferase [Kiritimatiellia bacterium]HRZ11360.1 class I SAM-dependent methyltransferase [Kiritimatiellia bacterium]HSA17089.1 class I SAM-dependent methyltransferase [Kiritimatiellia bacterium]
MYTIAQQPGPVVGLKYRPSLAPGRDDNVDFYNEFYRPVPREFSAANQEVLRQALLSVPAPRCIVEIGVQRNPLPESSTGILLAHKPGDCLYIGVDIEDKSHLDNASRRIHTLKMDSADRGRVYRQMEAGGAKTIDFLFIDGWHSVNQCLADWQYVERLAPDGVVVMHDTNVHPGPVAVFEAIDEALFIKAKYCTEGPDWGISVVRRRAVAGEGRV